MASSESKRSKIDGVHMGTMGWSYAFWVGRFYPDEAKPQEYLAEYSKRLESVEIDSTFYRIPSASVVRAWGSQTSEGFLFSAKFPRVITHVKMLRDCEEDVDRFIASVSLLKSKLGPLLLQFPSTFKAEHLLRLQDFLLALPKGYRYAVEVRDRSLLGERLHSLLRENRVALVLVDQPSAPLVEEVTADFVYVRWEGDRRKVNGTLGKVEADRTEDIRKWAEKIRSFLDSRIEVFGYFSKYYSGYPPADAKQLLDFL